MQIKFINPHVVQQKTLVLLWLQSVYFFHTNPSHEGIYLSHLPKIDQDCITQLLGFHP